MIVDGHLDVAYNVVANRRDLTLSVSEIRTREGQRQRGVAMTSLPSLAEADVGVVIATLWVEPARNWFGGFSEVAEIPFPPAQYVTPKQAEAAALEQLRVYEDWEANGDIRVILDRASLEDHLARFPIDKVPGFLIAMEGADPILRPEDVERWWDRGLRMIGLSWASTRYAGGTGSSEPLTSAGRELLHAMAQQGVIHDASHLSEESFWEAIGLPHQRLCVSHASPRALMTPAPGERAHQPLNRHLSDAQILEGARPRGKASRGVIGIPFINAFLDPGWDYFAPSGDVSFASTGARFLEHIAGVAGWESAIGSDVDSGYGRRETPIELESILDWSSIATHMPAAVRDDVLGGNWLRFLRETLP